jgi:NAD(P)-dependent dehydrogenase (short-subunit alcohol dehydrogenase family)
MIPQKYGRIVNIGSGTSLFGMPGISPYCAARGGMTQMTKALAAEWAPLGICVNALAPGWFKTAQNAVMYEDPEWVANVVARIPAGRSGLPNDMDGAVVFLASDHRRHERHAEAAPLTPHPQPDLGHPRPAPPGRAAVFAGAERPTRLSA